MASNWFLRTFISFSDQSAVCQLFTSFIWKIRVTQVRKNEFRTGEFVSRKMLLERFHKFHVETLLNGPKQLYKSCTNVQTKRLRERVADQVRSPISGKCKFVRLSCYRPLGENFFFSGQSTRFSLLTFIQLNSIVWKHFLKKYDGNGVSLKCFDTIDSEELNRRANFMIIETDYVRWRAGYTNETSKRCWSDTWSRAEDSSVRQNGPPARERLRIY